tara:strand:- start:1020 stop:1562 length:543 start_codon:yes stop_codon:yes gene_type:complete
MKVYFDMDGVLSDLEGDVARLSGFDDVRDMKSRGLMHENYLKQREDVGPYELFSEGTPIQPQRTRQLMMEIHAAGHTIEILTSLGVNSPLDLGDETHRGKADWLREHYSDLFEMGVVDRMNTTTKGWQKAFYANPDSLLIDDWKRNTDAFQKAGGLVVVFDRFSYNESVAQVRAVLGLEG